MNNWMSLQTSCLCESDWTNSAPVWLFPSVNSRMTVQSKLFYSVKVSEQNITIAWFLSTVNTWMSPQTSCMCESDRTNSAPVWLFPSVNFRMTVQSKLSSESIWTKHHTCMVSLHREYLNESSNQLHVWKWPNKLCTCMVIPLRKLQNDCSK